MSVTLISSAPRYLGESSDNKPSDAVVGAHFYEKDTRREYVFDGQEWWLIVQPEQATYDADDSEALLVQINDKLDQMLMLMESALASPV